MDFIKSSCKLFRQVTQVNKTLSQFIRNSSLSSYTGHDLSQSRSLVKITGRDTAVYLQNLITNDIHLLNEEKHQSIYAMILNNRGRVLHDVLIYRLNEPSIEDKEYLVEMDKSSLPDFLRILKIYSLKKKVKVTKVDEMFKVYSVTKNLATDTPHDLTIKETISEDMRLCVPDPRFSKLGYRVLTEHNTGTNFPNYFQNSVTLNSNPNEYKQELYKHGIAENHEDISYGKSIPLEYNIVLLDGVSFSKGCYLGQELIAKTHHTGVIRKRILPIVLKNADSLSAKFEQDCNVLNLRTGKSAGKLKNLAGAFGIAMLRLSELDKESLVLVDAEKNQHPISFNIPEYWKKDEKLAEQMKKFL